MSETAVHGLVGAYLDQLHDDGRAERTIVTYRSTLGMYARWLDEQGIDVRDVKPADVRAFTKRHRDDARVSKAGPSAGTRRRDIVTVRLFHQWAFEEGHGVPTVNSVRSPKVVDRGPNPLHDDVWRKIWLSDLDAHNRLWLGIGYFLGLRRFEIVSMPPEAIDYPRSGLMYFQRKGGKLAPIPYKAMVEDVAAELPWLTAGWERWIEQLQSTAAHRREIGADRLWWEGVGDPTNDGMKLNRRLDVILSRLDLVGMATPHRLRHSCATNLLRAGWPVDEVRVSLSHSSVDITQLYADYSGQTERRRARERA